METLREHHLSKELLRELFDYHEDGYLIWKERPLSHFNNASDANRFNTPNQGNVVGYFNKRTDSKREGFGYWKTAISMKGKGFKRGNFRVKRYRSCVERGKHNFFLGFYHTPEEAACAYNRAVVWVQPEYYKLNDVVEKDSYNFNGKFFTETLPLIKSGDYDWEAK